MAKEKRLIDANDVKREIWNTDCDVYEFCEGCVINMGISRVELDDAIDRVPTVDAVEVVRCKDCKHWSMGYCNHFAYYSYEPITSEDDFCSYGERREGE